jgi:NAD(P)H-nitrite reductase large subunit
MSTSETATDRTICRCLRVSASQIETAIAVAGCETVRDVSQATGAGKACMACHCRIKELLRSVPWGAAKRGGAEMMAA